MYVVVEISVGATLATRQLALSLWGLFHGPGFLPLAVGGICSLFREAKEKWDLVSVLIGPTVNGLFGTIRGRSFPTSVGVGCWRERLKAILDAVAYCTLNTGAHLLAPLSLYFGELPVSFIVGLTKRGQK